MVINSINCSYRTYNYSYVTRGPLLVEIGVLLSRSSQGSGSGFLNVEGCLKAHGLFAGSLGKE